jgi:hypothetical protein
MGKSLLISMPSILTAYLFKKSSAAVQDKEKLNSINDSVFIRSPYRSLSLTLRSVIDKPSTVIYPFDSLVLKSL